MSKKVIAGGLCAGLVLAAIGCANSGADSATGASSSVSSFPIGFAVGSLTNAGSSRSSASWLKSLVRSTRLDAGDPIEEKAAALETIAESSTAATCRVTLMDITTNAPGVNCYGPKLAYINHLEGTPDGNDTQDAGTANGGGDGSDGVLPGGDLGLWGATETDGTACAAAKVNADIQGINYKVDNALLLSASMTCVMNSEGETLPAVGASLDLTTAFSAAVTANNPTATVSSATISREADSGGNAVYLYTISAVLNSKNVTINLKHSPQNATNSEYKGRLWTAVSGTPSSGFSVSYEKTAANVLFEMTSSNFGNSESASNMFNSDGTFKLNGTWNGNIALTKAELSSTTYLGKFSYAWQAGTGDSHARIFNAYTTTSGADSVGYAFFGFGGNFSNAGAGTASDAVIDTFICNWAGPGGNHTGLTGKAQKQYIKFDGTKWVPNSGIGDPNLISYAPVTSCSRTLNQADTNARVFEYTSDFTSTFPAAWTGAAAALTHELVTLSSDTEFAGFSQPTAPASL